MEHSSSVDDLVGTFWDESPPSAKIPAALNRSSSEWSFQEFLKDNLPAGPLKLRPACKSRFLQDPERQEQGSEPEPFLRAAELRLYPRSEDPSAAVEGALNPLFSGLRQEKLIPAPDPTTIAASGGVVGSYPEEYECFLKHKLEMACAAVAMTRVPTIS